MFEEFLRKVGVWSRRQQMAPTAIDQHSIVAFLDDLTQQIQSDPSVLEDIQSIPLETELNASEIANVMSLIGHPDDEYQQQGLDLLLQSASEDVWASLMVGAEIGENIDHSTLNMSGALKAALLLNPFADYSDLTTLCFSSSPPPDLTCLRYCTNLTKITVQRMSLRGLKDATSVKALVVNEYDEEWFVAQRSEMVHLEELTIQKRYGDRTAQIDISLFSGCASLNKVRIVGHGVECTVSPAPTSFEIHLEDDDGFHSLSKNTLADLLPSSAPDVQIERLRYQYLTRSIDLSLLSRCQINQIDFRVKRHGRFTFSNVFSLLDLERIPTIRFEFDLNQPMRAEWAYSEYFPTAALLSDTAQIKDRLRFIDGLQYGEKHLSRKRLNVFNALQADEVPALEVAPYATWFFEEYVAFKTLFADPKQTKNLLRKVIRQIEKETAQGKRILTLDERVLMARPFFSSRADLTIDLEDDSHRPQSRRLKQLPDHLKWVASGVKSLTLIGRGTIIKKLALLEQFPDLEELVLQDFSVLTKTVFSQLVKCPALRSVVLMACPNVDVDLSVSYLTKKKSPIQVTVRQKGGN